MRYKKIALKSVLYKTFSCLPNWDLPPLPHKQESVSPLFFWGGGIRLRDAGKGGGSQFRRLEKNLCTLSALCLWLLAMLVGGTEVFGNPV
jgi:hypothetical protein